MTRTLTYFQSNQCRLLRLNQLDPRAIYLAIRYWYLRRIDLQNPLEILNATCIQDSKEKRRPVRISPAQKILLVIQLAIVAQTFGDLELEQLVTNKLRKRLQAESCYDPVVSATIQAIYAEEYNAFPSIRGLRRIVILEGCRRGFGRIFHSTGQDLSRLAAKNLTFCRDFAEVEEMDTHRPSKRARREATGDDRKRD